MVKRKWLSYKINILNIIYIKYFLKMTKFSAPVCLRKDDILYEIRFSGNSF